jgi:Phospholipid methyltransferase
VADRNGFLARWRVRLGYPLAPLYLWLALPTVKSLVWGMALALLGLLLRAVAAGHLHKQEELTVSGPYGWTRNPLYFGSFLLVSGFAVASHSWYAAALVVGYYAIFYPAVMRREEGELRRKHGEAFDAYAARVPLFFPRAPRRGGDRVASGQLFSWDQYGRNREYQAALGFMVGVMLLVARMLVAGAG